MNGAKRKAKIFRRYEFGRDEKGQVNKLLWCGDEIIPEKPKYFVEWINARSIRRRRGFVEYNAALNFFAKFPYGRAGLLEAAR